MLGRPVSGNWQWAAATINMKLNYGLAACSCALSTRSDTSSLPKTRKVIKTTKSVQDLPCALMRDGVPVAPLPEFEGGLELAMSPSSRPRKTTKAKKMVSSHIPNPQELEGVLKSAKPLAEGGNSFVPLPPDSSQITSKNVRKARMPMNDLAQEILQNLERFPDCILLTRVGQFYESYFDQAVEVAKLLSIKLALRRWDGEEIPMAGFPVPQIDRHLKTLVQINKRSVALCEEFRKPGQTEKIVRKVTRVLTPGTLIDESFLNPFENNYLLAIKSGTTIRESIGLAWIDVSTGEFFSESTNIQSLRDDLTRIRPSEVVLHVDTQSDPYDPIRLLVNEEKCHSSYAEQARIIDPRVVGGASTKSDNITSESTDPVFSVEETEAIFLLTSFLQSHLLDHMPDLTRPFRLQRSSRVSIDAQTIRALEIKEGMESGKAAGSLLSIIKRTVTQGGSRLLARWICAPSVCMREIQARQSIIALFCARRHLRDDIINLLKGLDDASRLIQRLSLGRGETDDLLNIRKTILGWCQIYRRLKFEEGTSFKGLQHSAEEWKNLNILLSHMVDLRSLAECIGNAVDTIDFDKKERIAAGFGLESESTQESDGPLPFGRPPYGGRWKIKPEFSAELTELHSKLSKLNEHKKRIEMRLQENFDAPSLSLRMSPSLGLHVHLSKARRDAGKFANPATFVVIQQSNTTKSYFYAPWTELGSQIIDVVNDLVAAEKAAFELIRVKLNEQISALRSNSRVIDELDVTSAFSILAEEMGLVRPRISESVELSITNGRHPTVEMSLLGEGRAFTPNSIELNSDSNLCIITGPNMGGKSTLLRQTALIVILAQTGSYVPAEQATIGLVDKIFSRIGARDELYRDRSTFMVEMLETSNILNSATSRSLVIMDEVGRGTTMKDGLAVAFGTIHHLDFITRCRTLFATHFHELADLLGYDEDLHSGGLAYSRIRFFCNDVDELDDSHFSYSHRIRPGVNRSSHGLKVARLAGMPHSALHIAAKTFEWLDAHPALTYNDRQGLAELGRQLANT